MSAAKHAMIFAAGLGTRLRPYTDDRPKALVEVGGKPLLFHQLEKLARQGYTDATVNVHHFAPMVVAALQSRDWGLHIHISDESDLLLDTGGGLQKALPHFAQAEEVTILNVDILSDLDLNALLALHRQSGALATLSLRKRETDRNFIFDSEMFLCGWENKKTGELKGMRPENSQSLAFSGIHVVATKLIAQMPAKGPYSIVETYLEQAGRRSIQGKLEEGGIWIDVGKPESLKIAEEIIAQHGI